MTREAPGKPRTEARCSRARTRSGRLDWVLLEELAREEAVRARVWR